MASQANQLTRSDEPFGRVVLVPLDGIAIVHWKLVMEIVVPFANGDESGDEVVAGCMFIVKGGFAKPMGEGVYAECRLREVSITITMKKAKVHTW
jgi:hypothetical protein